ncbi:MAG: AAA family ATPase [Treponema sp.]|nr:AAA family ATPase [Treponema sp.]
MDELFSAKNEKTLENNPLADRMRPRTLEDIVGQDHIVGEGRLLRRAIQADRLSSIILYGPPGTGKTSLAAVIANTTRAAFEKLNAVLSGVKDIREVIDRADDRTRLYSKRTILFVDEVHRWNKAQQDALLPWVENGTVILVGATTENPFFEVNRALVSRSRIFQLKALDNKGLMETALRTLSDKERGYGRWNVTFEDGALEHLVDIAAGDARSLLNAMELAIETSSWSLPEGETPNKTDEGGFVWPPVEGTDIHISMEAAEESIQRRALLYDRDGDYHFDTISAFIKSVRGSDPDAALYWLAKMVRAGEDPKFIFRRMIILASEDVGLADPNAISVVVSCAQAFERIGFPEGNFPLSQACLYLATAPKSNTTLSYFDALKEVEKEDAEVPNHLRDASRDAEGFGHGEGYIYPHAFRNHWAAQQYLPNTLKGRTFYIPSVVGYEGKIRDEVLEKHQLNIAIMLGEQDSKSEILSWSAASKGHEGWFKRLESGRSKLLTSDKNIIFSAASVSRHSRVLIPKANDGLLLWESLKRCPEGLSAGIVSNDQAKDSLLRSASIFDETEKPLVAVSDKILPDLKESDEWFSCSQFDNILLRAPRFNIEPSLLASSAKELLAEQGTFVLLYSPPEKGERISNVLLRENYSKDICERLKKAEEEFFSQSDNLKPENLGINDEDLTKAFKNAGFTVKTEIIDQNEERLITEKDLALWFNTEQSRWGSFMLKKLQKNDFDSIFGALQLIISRGPVLWQWKSICFSAKK